MLFWHHLAIVDFQQWSTEMTISFLIHFLISALGTAYSFNLPFLSLCFVSISFAKLLYLTTWGKVLNLVLAAFSFPTTLLARWSHSFLWLSKSFMGSWLTDLYFLSRFFFLSSKFISLTCLFECVRGNSKFAHRKQDTSISFTLYQSNYSHCFHISNKCHHCHHY